MVFASFLGVFVYGSFSYVQTFEGVEAALHRLSLVGDGLFDCHSRQKRQDFFDLGSKNPEISAVQSI
jgi:hypothetical protein